MTDTVISSATKEVVIGFNRPFVIIGERINPTGRKILAAEMAAGDFSRVESDARAQVEAGAHMLDVNAGIPLADEPAARILRPVGLMRSPMMTNGRSKPMTTSLVAELITVSVMMWSFEKLAAPRSAHRTSRRARHRDRDTREIGLGARWSGRRSRPPTPPAGRP